VTVQRSVLRILVSLTIALVLGCFFASPSPLLAQGITVTSTNPSSADQGTTLDVTIKGSGFKKGAKSQWLVTGTTDPGGVTVNSTTLIDSNTLVANITIAPDAQTELKYDVEVYSAGRTGKGIEVFSVIAVGGAASCTDIPLRVTIFGIADTSLGGIYGDTQNPADSSQYTDGVNGVYAKFQVCNESNDFILNLSKSSRFFVIDFSNQIVSGDTNPPKDPAQQVQFMNVNQVANLGLYTNNQLSTCMGSTFALRKGFDSHIRYSNSSVTQTTTNPGIPGCDDGVVTEIANQGGDTSVVKITKGDNCSSWVITPVPVPENTYDVTGLIVGTPKGFVDGGQYNMPFQITLTRTDGGGCSDLPQ
jgi:hypothetical protein